MMGIKWELVEKGEEIETMTEGITVSKIKLDGEKMRTVEVYVNKKLKKILQNTRI